MNELIAAMQKFLESAPTTYEYAAVEAAMKYLSATTTYMSCAEAAKKRERFKDLSDVVGVMLSAADKVKKAYKS